MKELIYCQDIGAGFIMVPIVAIVETIAIGKAFGELLSVKL